MDKQREIHRIDAHTNFVDSLVEFDYLISTLGNKMALQIHPPIFDGT